MKPNSTSAEPPALELKGSVLTVMVLHVRDTAPDRLFPQLEQKIGPARSFFNNAPVVIDLKAVPEETQSTLDIALLVATLRQLGMVPVGARGQGAHVEQSILAAGLGLLPAGRAEKTATIADRDLAAEAAPSPQERTDKDGPEKQPAMAKGATMVISHPVRSGQQIVAPDGDLVVLSSVNAGAEVLAAGSIHVYGALRGRAMAGIDGDVTARIFSLQCNPELVAVAGEYVVNDLLDRAVLNRSVIVAYGTGGLRFEVIGAFDPHG